MRLSEIDINNKRHSKWTSTDLKVQKRHRDALLLLDLLLGLKSPYRVNTWLPTIEQNVDKFNEVLDFCKNCPVPSDPYIKKLRKATIKALNDIKIGKQKLKNAGLMS